MLFLLLCPTPPPSAPCQPARPCSAAASQVRRAQSILSLLTALLNSSGFQQASFKTSLRLPVREKPPPSTVASMKSPAAKVLCGCASLLPEQPAPHSSSNSPNCSLSRKRPSQERMDPAGESPAPDTQFWARGQPAARSQRAQGFPRNSIPQPARKQRGKGKEQLSADGKAPKLSPSPQQR